MAIVIMIVGCGKEQIQNIENINNDGKTDILDLISLKKMLAK